MTRARPNVLFRFLFLTINLIPPARPLTGTLATFASLFDGDIVSTKYKYECLKYGCNSRRRVVGGRRSRVVVASEPSSKMTIDNMGH